MDCLEGCEWQKFEEGSFTCGYYNKILNVRAEMVDKDVAKYHIVRCDKCIEEGIIGTNKESNYLEGIRKNLVYLGDHFYSFKDEFEECLADLYRNLKKLEKGE